MRLNKQLRAVIEEFRRSVQDGDEWLGYRIVRANTDLILEFKKYPEWRDWYGMAGLKEV